MKKTLKTIAVIVISIITLASCSKEPLNQTNPGFSIRATGTMNSFDDSILVNSSFRSFESYVSPGPSPYISIGKITVYKYFNLNLGDTVSFQGAFDYQVNSLDTQTFKVYLYKGEVAVDSFVDTRYVGTNWPIGGNILRRYNFTYINQ